MPINVNVTREQLSKRKLFLATPMYGGLCNGIFARSVMDLSVLLSQWGVGLQVYYLFNESLITRARNYCADEFLRSDCTHMMFIDADIGFNPNDVMAMIALMDDDSPYDVLTGPYPKKCIAWEKIKHAVDKGFADKNPSELAKFCGDFVINPLPGQNNFRMDQPAEILEAGTGFMMIRRSAFALIDAARPDLRYKPDHARDAHFNGSREIMAYFMDPIDRKSKEKVYEEALKKILECDVTDGAFAAQTAKDVLAIPEEGSRRLLSEDYFFCQELRKAGGKIWLCPWMALQHAGSYIFDTTLQHMANLGVAATVDMGLMKPEPKPLTKAAALKAKTAGKGR